MFLYNSWLEQTGTIVYENDQQLVSGLVAYDTPYIVVTGTVFSVISRDRYIRKSDESHRARHDDLTVQFGQNEIYNLNDTGIYLEEGRTRLRYDGVEFRAIKVDDFGQKFNRYVPIGITQILFRKVTPLAY